MAPSTRLFKSVTRLILPVIVLIVLAVGSASAWLVYRAAHPTATKYLLTPDKYGRLSSRAAQVTDETWQNKDGSTGHGWLLRGAENAPAVILFHRYGADRSHMLDLGVKMNESTNFTILMPDLRAHGETPAGKNCTFGGCELEDVKLIIDFVRGLKTPTQIALVGKQIGVYGVELGGMYALEAAAQDRDIKALAVDSIPEDSGQLLAQITERRYPFASSFSTRLARLGTYIYFFDGCFRHVPTCDTARKVEGRNIILLGGVDAAAYQEPTAKLAKCLGPNNRVETKLDLSPSGMNIINASMEQSESYDQRLIDFFRNSLMN